MHILVNSDKQILFFILFSFFIIFVTTLIFYSLSSSAYFLIAYFLISFSIVIRYWVAIGRVILLDCEGVEVSFLWFKKKYPWSKMHLKKMFECKNAFGYRSAYSSGVELSCKEYSRPSWIQPIQYCFMFHPFSHIVIHFPITEKIPIKYPAIYEVNKDLLFRKLNEWGQGDGFGGQGDGLREP